jgi:hypothetical protein
MTRKLYGTLLTDYSLSDLQRMEWIFAGDASENRARLAAPRRLTVDSITVSREALATSEAILADIRNEIACRARAA